MPKQQNIYKRYLSWYPDKFDYDYACWANNHQGKSKAKRRTKRSAKRRMRQQLDKELKNSEMRYLHGDEEYLEE